MAATIHQDEQTGEHPAAPDGLSSAAAALPAGMVWRRLESWIARRWSPRQVVWIVKGPGEWRPPLAPADITNVEHWRGDGWHTLTVPLAPMGYALGAGKYRITALVGAGPVPDDAAEAYRRFAEYVAAESEAPPGASSYGVNLGQISENYRRNPAFMARAMEWSGAADLLRPYRRA